jgi:hypothetical protein
MTYFFHFAIRLQSQLVVPEYRSGPTWHPHILDLLTSRTVPSWSTLACSTSRIYNVSVRVIIAWWAFTISSCIWRPDSVSLPCRLYTSFPLVRLILCISHFLLVVLQDIPLNQLHLRFLGHSTAYCISSKPSGGGFVLDVLIFGMVDIVCSM